MPAKLAVILVVFSAALHLVNIGLWAPSIVLLNLRRFWPVIREIDSFCGLIHCYVPVGKNLPTVPLYHHKTMGLPFLWTGNPTDLLWMCNLLEDDSAFTKSIRMILFNRICAPRIQRASRCSRTLWRRSLGLANRCRSSRISGDFSEQCLVYSFFGSCDATALLHWPWNDWGFGWVSQSVSRCKKNNKNRFWLRVACTQESQILALRLKMFKVQDAECFCCSNNHCHPETGEVQGWLRGGDCTPSWQAFKNLACWTSVFFLQLSFFSVRNLTSSYLRLVATPAGEHQELPCDRVLIFKMLRRWYGKETDEKGGRQHLEHFNETVQVSLAERDER